MSSLPDLWRDRFFRAASGRGGAARLIIAAAAAALIGGGIAAPAAAQNNTNRPFPETYRSPTELSPQYLAHRTAQEVACADAVRGKVAWNSAGRTNWNERNIDYFCKGTTHPTELIDCFKGELGKSDDWKLAVEACKNAEASGRLFTDTITHTTTLAGKLPQFSKLEEICAYAVRDKVAWNQQGNTKWLESNIRELCRGTKNPDYTIACFKNEIARGSDYNGAIGWCKEANRVALGKPPPPPYHSDTRITQQQCTAMVKCGLTAVLANLPIPVPTGVPGCNGAALCAAIAEQDASQIDTIINAQGQCANHTGWYGAKEVLLDALGCGVQTGLEAAAMAGAPKVNWADVCAVSPDSLATSLVATLACAGTPEPRIVAGAASCPTGSTLSGPDILARFQRLLFVPGKPACVKCPSGFQQPENKWSQFAETASGQPMCYSACPAGVKESTFRPSKCRDGTERTQVPAQVFAPNQCPDGWETGSRLLTGDNFCMSKCDGVAAGEWCFGVTVNPKQAKAVLDNLPRMSR